jgi:DNA-binding transcriptional LysR family regulator
MRNLNLDQLRALMEVAELGSFSAAAQRLNLTQPAISVQIRELEGRLAVPLIHRVGKRAFLTPAGRELVDHARRIFDSTDRAMAAMRRHHDGGLGWVHVGSGPAALRYLLLPVLERLRAEHPGINVAVSTGNTADIVERLSRNAVDIGFTGLPVDPARFEATAVRDMTMVAILPDDGGHLPEVVTPADIADRPLIVTPERSNHASIARDWLRKADIDLRPAMEIDNVEMIKRVVAAGLGVALVPGEAISLGDPVEGLVARPLDPPLALTLALIRRRDGPDDQALRIVRDAIMTLADGTAETVMAPTEAVHPVGKAKSKAKSRERTGAAPKKPDDDRTRATGSAPL